MTHPMAVSLVNRLRDTSCDASRFRHFIAELARVLTYEAFQQAELTSSNMKTLQGRTPMSISISLKSTTVSMRTNSYTRVSAMPATGPTIPRNRGVTMQGKLIKLGLLVFMTAIFAVSHSYYSSKEKETQDAIAVMEYKVLDKKMWSMEEAAKNHALSKDSSYDEISVLKRQNKDAAKKQKIGFWLMVIFGVATTGYMLYVLYLYSAGALAERKRANTSQRKL